MYCSSCGKVIPESSSFCMHCGAPIQIVVSVDPPKITPEWEYRDFVYEIPRKGCAWVPLSGNNAYTFNSAKLFFWSEYQRTLMPLLQKWYDLGWEPIDEVGPSSFEIRECRDYRNRSTFYWIFMAFVSIPSFGLILLFALLDRDYFAEPSRFVVQMRAPKGTAIPELMITPPMVSVGRPAQKLSNKDIETTDKNNIKKDWVIIPIMILIGFAFALFMNNFGIIHGGYFWVFIFLFSGIGFMFYFIKNRDQWWAILPMGLMFTQVLLNIVGELFVNQEIIFFFGIGTTFAILALLPLRKERFIWAWIPAIVLILISFSSLFVGSEGLLLPGLLIIISGLLFYFWRKSHYRSSAE